MLVPSDVEDERQLVDIIEAEDFLELERDEGETVGVVAEMNIRYQAGYPPYYYTVRIMASNEDERAAAKAIYEIRNQLSVNLSKETVVLGPTPRPIARMKNRYYYQIIVKYKHDPKLHALLKDIMRQTQAKSRQDTLVSIDPEPQYFM